MSAPSDSDLDDWARRVRAGDLSAFEALFRALHPRLSRLAVALAPSPPEAEDAVQETFARLWEHRERIDPERSIAAYLARSVRNRLFNASRDGSTRRELLLSRADDTRPDPPPRPDAVAHASGVGAQVRAALHTLPPRQRTAIALTRFEGLSHVEAAEVMTCSARTVNNHIVRGLRTLRDRLQALESDVR